MRKKNKNRQKKNRSKERYERSKNKKVLQDIVRGRVPSKDKKLLPDSVRRRVSLPVLPTRKDRSKRVLWVTFSELEIRRIKRGDSVVRTVYLDDGPREIIIGPEYFLGFVGDSIPRREHMASPVFGFCLHCEGFHWLSRHHLFEKRVFGENPHHIYYCRDCHDILEEFISRVEVALAERGLEMDFHDRFLIQYIFTRHHDQSVEALLGLWQKADRLLA